MSASVDVAVSETRNGQVYQLIRTDILAGNLAPGQSLQFAQLRTGYGGSMGVIREALMRLSAERLVVSEDQRGFRVMQISAEDLIDLTESRCVIEGLVLHDAVTHGSLEWESGIVAARHRLERTQKVDPASTAVVTDEWSRAHHAFHMALLSGASTQRLKHFANLLRDSAEVYRRWSMPMEEPVRGVSDEHQRLADLALARDAEGAVAELRRHLELTRDLVLKYFERKEKAIVRR